MPQIQSMDNISEPASRLLEDYIDKVFNLITNQNINVSTQGKVFVLCTPVFYNAIEIYFKNGNILKIVIFIHSIWNNKIFPSQIPDNCMHDKHSVKKGYFCACHPQNKMQIFTYMDHMIHKTEVLKCIFPFCMMHLILVVMFIYFIQDNCWLSHMM